MAALPCRALPTHLGLANPLSQLSEVDRRDRRPMAGDLGGELLSTFGRGRLERERPQPLRDFGLQIARPLDLLCDAGELQLGAVASPLEAPETGSVLDQSPPLGRARREDRFDLALADDRARSSAKADVGEQLDDVEPAHGRAVDQVLALAAAVEPPDDRDLAEVEARHRPVGVVEQQLDLAEIGGLPRRGAVEEDVVRLLGSQLARGEAARGPHERVGDVRLARSVRPDDDRHPRLEAHLDLVGKALEPPHADGLQIHARATLTISAAGTGSAAACRTTRLSPPRPATRAPARRPAARPPSSSVRCRCRAARRRSGQRR